MICKRCGADIDTSLSVNGTLQCPSCGTVYQSRRASSAQQQPAPQSYSQPSASSENLSNTGRRRRSAIYESTAQPTESPASAPKPVPEPKPAPVAPSQPQRQATNGYVPPTVKAGPTPTPKVGRVKLPSGKIIAIVLATVVAIGGIAIVINNNTTNNSTTVTSASNSVATQSPEDALLKEVSDVLVRLETAYNNIDLYGIMQCFDPGVSDGLFAGAKLLGFSGADALKSLLPLGSGLFNIYATNYGSAEWPPCKLTPLSYEGNEYRGTLNYNVKLTHNDGSVDSFDEPLSIQKIDGTWYISAIQNTSTATTATAIASANASANAVPETVTPATDVTNEDIQSGVMDVTSLGYSSTTSRNAIEYKFISNTGKLLFTGGFAEVDNNGDGHFLSARRGTKWGLISASGATIVDFQFFKPEYLGNGYWKIQTQDGRGLINPTTGESVPCEYSGIGIPSEGYVPASKNGYWGIITTSGNVVVDFIYTGMADAIHSGLVEVKINKASGVIDVHGKEIIKLSPDFSVDQILPNGVIVHRESQRLEFFNRSGTKADSMKILWNSYSVDVLSDEYVIIEDDGIVDSNGHCFLISDKLKSMVSDIDTIKVYPDTFDGEWFLIEYITRKSYSDPFSYYTNYINTQGKLKYQQSIPGGVLAHSSGNRNIILLETPNSIYVWCDSTVYGPMPVMAASAGIVGQNYVAYGPNDINGGQGWIFEYSTGSMYPIYSISLQHKLPLSSRSEYRWIEVSDGIYKGLLTDKGLVGQGLKYNKVDGGSYKYAAITSPSGEMKVYIGNDGAAYTISSSSSVEMPIVPLSTALTGTKVPGSSIESIIGSSGSVATVAQEAGEAASPIIELEQDESAETIPTSTPDPTSVPTPTPDPGTVEFPMDGYTNIKKVKVRKNADIESAVVTRLDDPGTHLTVTAYEYDGSGTLWYVVTLDDGQEGYIRSDLISFTPLADTL